MTMPTPLRVLVVEDSLTDAEIVIHILEKAGFEPDWQRVDSEEDFLDGLHRGYDLILADFNLPQFDALQALEHLRNSGLDIPLIVLTGALGDEAAVECIKQGAADYLLKDRLARLGGAVHSALAGCQMRLQKSQADQLLRESEEKFRTLVEAMPHAVWTSRPDGKPEYFNNRWYEITGLPQGEKERFGAGEAIHPDDLPRCKECWREALRSGSPFQIEYRFKDRPTGGYRWFLGRTDPIRNTQGEIVKWIGTCTDIDDQKRLAQSLQRHNSELEQFAFATAHDLQEPLRLVITQAQLLARKFPSQLEGEAGELVHHVVSSAERMRNLLRAMLAYAEVNRHEVALRPVESLNCLAQAVGELREPIENSAAEITYGPLPSVLAEAGQLTQVFRLLLENALLYRREAVPPLIHITAQATSGNILLFSVADNGVGIDPIHYKHIFGLFKRLHAVSTPGAGVGLSLCQKIIERHGGSIWVESGSGSEVSAGSGATFYFTLRGTVGKF